MYTLLGIFSRKTLFRRVANIAILADVRILAVLPSRPFFVAAMKSRILIVDDNEAIRKALTALLGTRENWEVCGHAQNGKEGVAKTLSSSPIWSF